MLGARIRSIAAAMLARMDSDYRIPLLGAIASMAVGHFAKSSPNMLVYDIVSALELGFFVFVMRSIAIAKTAARQAVRVRSDADSWKR
jgi:hypothetical protein